MAAIDDPDNWSFSRVGDTKRSETVSTWHQVLAGRALITLMSLMGRTAALAGIMRHRSRSRGGLSGMRPGITRGGKRIDDVGDK